jgi:RNA polymerase sigma-70 factor (ECF subfamily)
VEEKLDKILQGCQVQSRRSQEELYKFFYAYGITVALHYAKDMEQAKSVYNDAMLKALTKIDQYKGEVPFRAWLRRIVINSAVDHNRLYFKNTTVEYNDETNAIHTPHTGIESLLATDDILQMIQRIAPSYRTVFLLHAVEGYKFTEIATQLNITEGGAKTLYSKAKQKLQAMVKTI